MPWQLNVTAQLVHTDSQFHADGPEYTYTSSANFAGEAPQAADLNTLVSSTAAAVSAQLQAQFPVQQAQNSDNGAGGGAG